MPAVKAPAKYKTVIYLPEDIKRHLWIRRANNSIPVSTQIVSIISDHFDSIESGRKSKAKPERATVTS